MNIKLPFILFPGLLFIFLLQANAQSDKAAGKNKRVTETNFQFQPGGNGPGPQKNGRGNLQENTDQSERQANPGDVPLYPDLTATGIQENPSETQTLSKEKPTKQLVRTAPANKEREQSTITTDNTDPEQITLSPLKRKYLEEMAKELAREIQLNAGTAAEMQAKKKELEDLQELLSK